MNKLFRHKLSTINYRPSCNKGFSLIEMMIALFILTFSMLALLSMVIASMQVNLQNDVRNTAIRLTTQTAEMLLSQAMNSPALSASCTTTTPCNLAPYNATNAALGSRFSDYPNPVQTIRGGSYTYTVIWSVNDLTDDLKEVAITVSWTYRNQNYTNAAVVHKHRAV